MQEGEIVESGKHDELMARDQYYAKLHKKQFAPS
jgi:ABC-type multidrug transport system fused ATPase/permease subunit